MVPTVMIWWNTKIISEMILNLIKNPFLKLIMNSFLVQVMTCGEIKTEQMLPWAIISACTGDITLGVAILILWAIMSIVRQFIEPRIVSGQIGIHPIFTLIAMYTGYKFIGILGMIVGPIILIIIKNYDIFNHNLC